MRKLVAVLGATVVLGATQAAAAAAGTTNTQLNISPQAQLVPASDGPGNTVAVSFTFTCSGGMGSITFSVTQSAAQSNAGFPPEASGSGFVSAKCDGRSHKVTDTASGFFFNQGTATVNASLSSPGGDATDTKVVDVNQP
jgi:hypothetical protein